MTVAANSRRREYEGNGVTTIFNGPSAYGPEEITAFLFEDGESTPVSPDDFEVRNFGRESGTRVKMAVAPAVGQTLVLLRTVPYAQGVDITNQGAFLPETIEKGYDNLAFQTQQLADGISRSLRFPDDYPVSNIVVDMPFPEPGRALVWSEDGTRVVNAPLDLTGDLLLRPALAVDEPGRGASLVGYLSGTVKSFLDGLRTAGSATGSALVGFIQGGVGDVARTTQDKLRETVSVRDFGAVGDGIADDTAAINNAAAYAAAGKRSLYFPSGVYLLSGSTIAPSNSLWFGDGEDGTILKLADTAPWRTNVITVGLANAGVTNVVIRDMTLDCNWPVRSVTAVEGSGAYDGTGLLIRSSSNVKVERVTVIGAYRHCIDVTALTYTKDNGNPLAWADLPSHDVQILNCTVSGAGDDNITTHQSYNILIEGCVSRDPNGHYVPGNSNCYEIDDGSRHVTVSNCIAIGGSGGMEIKGHTDAAAPYDVTVTNFTAINNLEGFSCFHVGFDGGANGYSKTARGIFVENMTIIAPALRSTYEFPDGATGPYFAVGIAAYRDVVMRNIRVMDSAYGDPAGDYEPSQQCSKYVVGVRSGARDVRLSGVSVLGDLWGIPSGNIGAVTVQHSETFDVTVDGLTVQGFNGRAFYSTTTSRRTHISNFNVEYDPPYDAATSVLMGSVDGSVGKGTVVGASSQVGVSGNALPYTEAYGNGNPNGVVTAPPGSIYTNREGGAGAAVYVKESGTGNTGWVAK